MVWDWLPKLLQLPAIAKDLNLKASRKNTMGFQAVGIYWVRIGLFLSILKQSPRNQLQTNMEEIQQHKNVFTYYNPPFSIVGIWNQAKRVGCFNRQNCQGTVSKLLTLGSKDSEVTRVFGACYWFVKRLGFWLWNHSISKLHTMSQTSRIIFIWWLEMIINNNNSINNKHFRLRMGTKREETLTWF